MFEELYAPLPDKARFLERLGLKDVTEPDLETLNRLILAHQMNVPFENLSVYDAETDVSLDIASLFDKIVVRRRGGYCFELNALFMSLLESLGYDCYPVMVRVVWMSTAYLSPTAPESSPLTASVISSTWASAARRPARPSGWTIRIRSPPAPTTLSSTKRRTVILSYTGSPGRAGSSS
jgi:arylamine N-acetyltransferase